MSGYYVVRTLRDEANWVPVLMLSAKDGEYDQADGLDYGADDYLTKPFSFVVLLARLRALVRRNRPAPAVLAAGGLTLDPATHPSRSTAPTPILTPREYALLEYLLAPPRRWSARTELLDNVWDAGGRPERGRGLHRVSAAQGRPRADPDGARRRLPGAG